MTENRRIILNIGATYGRSLFALACGLFTSRWVLMALGQSDYGLYGVVGGLTAFIAFFNGLMAGAVGRFYAFSVGQAKVAGTQGEGLEVCRQWFNTAVLIHTVVPLILIAIGYPVGMWAVEHFLTIPPERVEACRWVFRFVCISCFVGMVNVPFQAMYTAKQYIAELTIYSFATTTLNVCFLYFMVTHPGDWLAKYALWTCLLSVVPQGIICLRAMTVFPECRFRLADLWSLKRIKTLVFFAGWQFFGVLGTILRNQGIAVLVNKFFGPSVNAAMTVGNSLSAHADTLSGSMIGAFAPAITNARGARDLDKMRRMAYWTCNLGTLFMLLFALPLALELPEVLRLWLKNPPPFTVGLGWLILLRLVLDKVTYGHMLAINANGKVAVSELVQGGALLLTLPLAWWAVAVGYSVYSVMWVVVVTTVLCSVGRVLLARHLIAMSVRQWCFRILVPLLVLTVVSGTVGWVPRLFFGPSFLRVCLTTVVTEAVMLPAAWFLLLDKDERDFVLGHLPILKRLRRVA